MRIKAASCALCGLPIVPKSSELSYPAYRWLSHTTEIEFHHLCYSQLMSLISSWLAKKDDVERVRHQLGCKNYHNSAAALVKDVRGYFLNRLRTWHSAQQSTRQHDYHEHYLGRQRPTAPNPWPGYPAAVADYWRAEVGDTALPARYLHSQPKMHSTTRNRLHQAIVAAGTSAMLTTTAIPAPAPAPASATASVPASAPAPASEPEPEPVPALLRTASSFARHVPLDLRDPFARMPADICLQISHDLPWASIQDLRVASRAFNSLQFSQHFYRSLLVPAISRDPHFGWLPARCTRALEDLAATETETEKKKPNTNTPHVDWQRLVYKLEAIAAACAELRALRRLRRQIARIIEEVLDGGNLLELETPSQVVGGRSRGGGDQWCPMAWPDTVLRRVGVFTSASASVATTTNGERRWSGLLLEGDYHDRYGGVRMAEFGICDRDKGEPEWVRFDEGAQLAGFVVAVDAAGMCTGLALVRRDGRPQREGRNNDGDDGDDGDDDDDDGGAITAASQEDQDQDAQAVLSTTRLFGAAPPAADVGKPGVGFYRHQIGPMQDYAGVTGIVDGVGGVRAFGLLRRDPNYPNKPTYITLDGPHEDFPAASVAALPCGVESCLALTTRTPMKWLAFEHVRAVEAWVECGQCRGLKVGQTMIGTERGSKVVWKVECFDEGERVAGFVPFGRLDGQVTAIMFATTHRRYSPAFGNPIATSAFPLEYYLSNIHPTYLKYPPRGYPHQHRRVTGMYYAFSDDHGFVQLAAGSDLTTDADTPRIEFDELPFIAVNPTTHRDTARPLVEGAVVAAEMVEGDVVKVDDLAPEPDMGALTVSMMGWEGLLPLQKRYTKIEMCGATCAGLRFVAVDGTEYRFGDIDAKVEKTWDLTALGQYVLSIGLVHFPGPRLASEARVGGSGFAVSSLDASTVEVGTSLMLRTGDARRKMLKFTTANDSRPPRAPLMYKLRYTARTIHSLVPLYEPHGESRGTGFDSTADHGLTFARAEGDWVTWDQSSGRDENNFLVGTSRNERTHTFPRAGTEVEYVFFDGPAGEPLEAIAAWISLNEFWRPIVGLQFRRKGLGWSEMWGDFSGLGGMADIARLEIFELRTDERVEGLYWRQGAWLDAVAFQTNFRVSPWYGKEDGGSAFSELLHPAATGEILDPTSTDNIPPSAQLPVGLYHCHEDFPFIGLVTVALLPASPPLTIHDPPLHPLDPPDIVSVATVIDPETGLPWSTPTTDLDHTLLPTVPGITHSPLIRSAAQEIQKRLTPGRGLLSDHRRQLAPWRQRSITVIAATTVKASLAPELEAVTMLTEMRTNLSDVALGDGVSVSDSTLSTLSMPPETVAAAFDGPAGERIVAMKAVYAPWLTGVVIETNFGRRLQLGDGGGMVGEKLLAAGVERQVVEMKVEEGDEVVGLHCTQCRRYMDQHLMPVDGLGLVLRREVEGEGEGDMEK